MVLLVQVWYRIVQAEFVALHQRCCLARGGAQVDGAVSAPVLENAAHCRTGIRLPGLLFGPFFVAFAHLWVDIRRGVEFELEEGVRRGCTLSRVPVAIGKRIVGALFSVDFVYLTSWGESQLY